MKTLIEDYKNKVFQHRILGLYRTRMSLINRSGTLCKNNTQNFLCFINNDYLGLANHPKVIHALTEGAAYYGVGSSASALLGGYYGIHQKLEEQLAEFLKFERVLIFSSGFMANLAVLTTLIHHQDYLFTDRLNHASLIDGIRYTKVPFKRYRRHNLWDLEKNIAQKTHSKNKWILTEGIFSMDGDIAPLPALSNLAKRYQGQLLIDDAHGIGVLGKNGRGTIEYHQISSKNITILTGTFGKAFGTMGAFVAGDHDLIETLIQFGRNYIYTTALSPAIASATYTSLQLIEKEYWRREYLKFLIHYFKKNAQTLNLPLLPSTTPIQTLMIGSPKDALVITELLKKKGILVGCIRPPTVPLNTSRLRINLNIHHTCHHVDFLLETLSIIWKKHIDNISTL